MKLSLCIFIGSGIGGVCRYFMTQGIASFIRTCGIEGPAAFRGFPVGTFVVNMIGCFLIGVIYALLDKGVVMTPETRNFLTVGFCGGLTTFSTFSHENYLLFTGNNVFTLLLYAVLSLIIGFSFAWLGHTCVQ